MLRLLPQYFETKNPLKAHAVVLMINKMMNQCFLKYMKE